MFTVSRSPSVGAANGGKNPAVENATEKVVQGQQIFRFDTFGSQAFWGDNLKLHQAIGGAALGGVGPGVSPKTALAVGLKVDVDALPSNLLQQILHGQVDLNDPAVTLALLKLNAVVGLTGFFNSSGTLQSVGIHDGRFADLNAVVNHYNSCMKLGLTPGEESDLIQYS
jgi:hypothetical protein